LAERIANYPTQPLIEEYSISFDTVDPDAIGFLIVNTEMWVLLLGMGLCLTYLSG
jgi:hypothetical protein